MREYCPGDGKVVMLSGPHDAEAGEWIVAGHDDDFDQGVVRIPEVVQREKPLDEGERDPGSEGFVEVLVLEAAVGFLAFALEHGVGFFEVEQRA